MMKSLTTLQMNRLMTFGGFALLMALIAIDGLFGTAHAQTSPETVFTDMQNKTTDLFYQGRTIILIVCSVAIIVTMVSAISGRFPMQKAIVIAGAIFIIAVASSVVSYFASPTVPAGNGVVPQLTDTENTTG